MVVRRVGALSYAKLNGMLCAFIGLLIGAVFSLLSLIGASMGSKGSGAMGMLMGVGAIILFPIFYGIIGFIAGLIGAFLYNLVAGWVGGIELDVV